MSQGLLHWPGDTSLEALGQYAVVSIDTNGLIRLHGSRMIRPLYFSDRVSPLSHSGDLVLVDPRQYRPDARFED